MESMTGFGKGIYQNEKSIISVYAKSVNSKYLDIILRLPKRYIFLEERIRKLIAQNFKRGKIEIQVKYIGTLEEKEIFIDIETAKKLKNLLNHLKTELGFEEALTYSDFLKFRDFLIFEEKEQELDILWEEIYPALNKALEELKNSRLKEGKLLREILKKYLEDLKKEILKIETIKEKIIKENQKNLKTKIEKILKDWKVKDFDENRFYQELAYFIDKLDFTEELDRLKTHLYHFELIMDEENCGKKLDFLCQEMFREINTLSNKACSPEVSLIGVEIKNLIEKLREQIQNIA